MKEWIQKWSGRTELLVVLLVAFGGTVPRSVAALLSPQSLALSASPPISNRVLQHAAVYEIAILTLLGLFLHARGWTLKRLGFQPSLRDSALGVAIFVVYYLVYAELFMGVASLWPRFSQIAQSTHLVAPGLTWTTTLTASLINPVFEEVFVCGYIISALKGRRGLTTAVNVSAGIRVSYHFYQGAVGVIAIVPMALLFAYWFARTGRLWPLIAAHALQDFVGLAASM